MLAALVLAFTAAVAEPPGKEPAAKLELFAKEDWYKDQKGKEEEFTGVLEKVKAPEVGFGRFNAYRLVMGEGDKKMTREVYVGNKKDILDAYIGKKIKLTGKAVDMEVEGTMHKEIWPARLELIEAEKKEEKKDSKADEKAPKIVASATWVHGGGPKPKTSVIRTAEEAAVALGLPADKAKEEGAQKEATEKFAQLFKVEKIDWQKQMIVTAALGTRNTGGYSVEFTGLEIKDKTFTVKWKENGPKPGQPVLQVITMPAGAALVERFEGEVKFDPAAEKPKEKDK
jgi:hypothetical protein